MHSDGVPDVQEENVHGSMAIKMPNSRFMLSPDLKPS